jgi:hypothetical protein
MNDKNFDFGYPVYAFGFLAPLVYVPPQDFLHYFAYQSFD